MGFGVDPEDDFKESVLRSMMIICLLLMMLFIAIVLRGNL